MSISLRPASWEVAGTHLLVLTNPSDAGTPRAESQAANLPTTLQGAQPGKEAAASGTQMTQRPISKRQTNHAIQNQLEDDRQLEDIVFLVVGALTPADL